MGCHHKVDNALWKMITITTSYNRDLVDNSLACWWKLHKITMHKKAFASNLLISQWQNYAYLHTGHQQISQLTLIIDNLIWHFTQPLTSGYLPLSYIWILTQMSVEAQYCLSNSEERSWNLFPQFQKTAKIKTLDCNFQMWWLAI